MKTSTCNRSRFHRGSQRAEVPSLRQIPHDFSWKFLSLLGKELGDRKLLSDEFAADLYSTIRSRSVSSYYSLDDRWGLQRIARDRTSPGGFPPAVRQLTALLRKYPPMCLKDASTRREECLSGVKTWDSQLATVTIHKGGVLAQARDIIQEILGDVPDLDEVLLLSRHGPGSAQGISIEEGSAYFKYALLPYRCYSDSVPLLKRLICEDQRWLAALLTKASGRFVCIDSFLDTCIEGVDMNRVSSVPKDGRKDRPIAIEPAGAVMLQLGVDGVIRRRLRAFGCDLNSQLKNQRLAKRASLDGSMVTLDLSNASDSVSCKLLEELLPLAWFRLVMSLRAKRGAFPDGSEIHYVKFASMGNGMTFVIQSLVFLSLIRSVERLSDGHENRRDHAVYGDDLVCLTRHVQEVLLYLRDWGFKVNSEKSFLNGFVTESCGTDWIEGVDIRPVFMNKLRNLIDLTVVRNRLNRWFRIHLGEDIPLALDTFLLSYWKGEILLGPTSNVCFGGYIHAYTPVHERPIKIRELFPVPRRRQGHEFDFRKLMHNLKDCTSESGGRFVVTQREDDPQIRVRARVQWSGEYLD